jgi:hypothetical protein
MRKLCLKEEGKPMLRDLFYYYNQGLLKIMGFALLVVLPWQIFIFGWIYSIFQMESSSQYLFALFLYLFMFISTQKPFIHLYQHVKANEEYGMKNMLIDFISSFGMIAFGSLCIFLFSYLGMGFYILPGFILLSFVFLLPFYQENQRSIKKLLTNGLSFFKGNFLQVYADLLLWVSIDVILWVVFLNGMSAFELNLITYTMLRIVINLFLFPFIYFYLAEKYQQSEWLGVDYGQN